MKRLITQNIERLVPYPPGKPMEELERELGITGSIKLASNENPLGPSPLAVRAILENVDKIHRYPDGKGYYLKEKLSEMFSLPLERIIIGNGSNEIIELIIRTFLVPGEQVIQPFPTFLVYEKMVTGAGGELISVPLDNFRISLQRIIDEINSRTKIIFINNPNNPTGSALLRTEVVDFLKNVPEDIIIVLDEAYIEFVTEKGVADGIDLIDKHPHLVVLRTFSKLFGLAGLRTGYGFASEEIINYMDRVRQPFNVNVLAQQAALAALDDREFMKDTLELVHDGLDYLFKELEYMGLEYLPTQANFFLIKVPFGAKKTYDLMLREGVIVRSMDSYGLEDYIRINVGLPAENERFINTLKKVLAPGPQ